VLPWSNKYKRSGFVVCKLLSLGQFSVLYHCRSCPSRRDGCDTSPVKSMARARNAVLFCRRIRIHGMQSPGTHNSSKQNPQCGCHNSRYSRCCALLRPRPLNQHKSSVTTVMGCYNARNLTYPWPREIRTPNRLAQICKPIYLERYRSTGYCYLRDNEYLLPSIV
jgi:hypothetical protein